MANYLNLNNTTTKLLNMTKDQIIRSIREEMLSLDLSNCPYSMKQLQSRDQSEPLSLWRHVHIARMICEPYSLYKVGAKYNRTHATAKASLIQVYNALNGKNDKLLDVIEKCCKS